MAEFFYFCFNKAMTLLKRLLGFGIAIALLAAFLPQTSKAAELYNDLQETFRAEVLEIVDYKLETIPGFDVSHEVQTIRVKILSGSLAGEERIISNDRIMLSVGDKFFLDYLITIGDQELFLIQEPDRTPVLIFLVLLFVAVVIIFGGFQGVRSLISLAGSFFIIFYLLLPNLLGGMSPLIAGLGFSSLILVVAIFLTHGINPRSLSALSGTLITISLAFFLAEWAVRITKLTGFTEDASIYLNLNSGGTLNLAGLLLSGIIIGILGILDDIAITQASVVEELRESAPHLSRKEIYFKAMRVGREHVSALINTLALAYTGAALPLLLFFYSTEAPLSQIISREIFVSEIIRVIVGSIAVILAVPITTFLASVIMIRHNKK
jgi:uncharacterized membrane protein